MASSAQRLMELQDQLSEAHRQAALAADGGMEAEAYEWRQEARALAQQLESERIERPFNSYENEYGDYPI